MKISSIIVAFLENMNFNRSHNWTTITYVMKSLLHTCVLHKENWTLTTVKLLL